MYINHLWRYIAICANVPYSNHAINHWTMHNFCCNIMNQYQFTSGCPMLAKNRVQH